MKKKLIVALPILLVGLGGVYKFVLAKPAPAPKPKVDGEAAAAAPPEGFGALPQEAVVRDIVTNSLTGVSGAKLIHRKGREQLKKRILRQILKKTDVKAEDVLFTDVAVQ